MSKRGGWASRIKHLITRKFTWADAEGNETTTTESWGAAWAMCGIHSWDWRWVHRWGTLPCNCVRNPLTRRLVLYAHGCEEHR